MNKEKNKSNKRYLDAVMNIKRSGLVLGILHKVNYNRMNKKRSIKYFIGVLVTVYGFFAFTKLLQHPILSNFWYTVIIGIITVMVGFTLLFYEF